MATRTQQTTNYKQIFWLILLIFLGLIARWGYLKVADFTLQKSIVSVQKKIDTEQTHLKSFSDQR